VKRKAISFKRRRFSPDIIRYAVWLYFRFTLSFGDIDELLAALLTSAMRLSLLDAEG
jgi:transposase-like protein